MKYYSILLLTILIGISCNTLISQNKTNDKVNCKIIKKISINHCARGLNNCKKCREVYHTRYCLLNICPKGDYARPVTEVMIDNKKQFREYEILKTFETFAEAQKYSVENKTELIIDNQNKTDTKLSELEKKLPSGWTMKLINDQLIIERTEPVYTILDNKINAPLNLEKKEDRDKRIKENGKKDTCRIVFFVENKWYKDRFYKLKAHNDTVYKQMTELPEKYAIQNLRNRFSKTEQDMYKGSTEEETKRINDYFTEKKMLEKNIVKLPDYISENYCIYLISKNGAEDEFVSVSPQKASQELYSIISLFSDNLEVWE